MSIMSKHVQITLVKAEVKTFCIWRGSGIILAAGVAKKFVLLHSRQQRDALQIALHAFLKRCSSSGSSVMQIATRTHNLSHSRRITSNDHHRLKLRKCEHLSLSESWFQIQKIKIMSLTKTNDEWRPFNEWCHTGGWTSSKKLLGQDCLQMGTVPARFQNSRGKPNESLTVIDSIMDSHWLSQ